MTLEAYEAALAEIEATGDAADSACLECGFTWDDSKSTTLTPVPAGRCPNEYNHEVTE